MRKLNLNKIIGKTKIDIEELNDTIFKRDKKLKKNLNS